MAQTSRLRQRMIEDLKIRNLSPSTQRSYVHAVAKLSRSRVYYRAHPVSAADLAIMRRMDELQLDYPFADSRMLRDLLRGEGVTIGRQHIIPLLKRNCCERPT